MAKTKDRPFDEQEPKTGASRPSAGSETESLRVLAQVAELFNSTLDLDLMLERVAHHIHERVPFDNFGILLLDDLGKDLTFRFATGYPEDVVKYWRFGPGQGLVGTAVQTGKAIRVDDVTVDTRYITAREGVRSEMVIPLSIKGRVIGVLDVASFEPAKFSQADQELMSLLAGRLANAIEQARLYENLKTQTRTLSLMHEVSRELTSILDREELLRKVAHTIKRLIDFQLFGVMLFNEEEQMLRNVFSLRLDERVHDKSDCVLGKGLCGTAAALRQTIRAPNVQLDPRFEPEPEEFTRGLEIRSEMVVPLVFKDKLLGVIDLESSEYNAFTEEHEQMLSTLASYIAIALENSFLYERVSADERRLEKDLRTAREIQRGLLPEAPPRIPGLDIAFAYEPARQLGGDIYDFLPHGDGMLTIVVGDVTGKGTPAALYGSLAVGILRGHIVEHPCQPAELLELVNDHLRQPRLETRYVALGLAQINTHTREMILANAGFPQPWLLRGGKAEEIQVEGVPAGLLPDIRYEQKSLQLETGDIVVFCSDGINEALNKEQEEMGLGRLGKTISGLAENASAEQIARGIMWATDRYTKGNEARADDRTVVVVKVTG